jgi:hypothetical protein
MTVDEGGDICHSEDVAMKLADIDINDLILALETEQSEWNEIFRKENRKHTDAEMVTGASFKLSS